MTSVNAQHSQSAGWEGEKNKDVILTWCTNQPKSGVKRASDRQEL